MRFFRNAAVSTLTLLALVGLSQPGQAQIFNETTDAGNTIATSVALPVGTTTVNGSLLNDVDLFSFQVTSPALVTLLVPTDNFDFDPNLLLFNSLGQGIGASDDQGGGVTIRDARITINLSAGTYYVAVGDNNIAGYTNGSVEFLGNDDGDDDGVIFLGPTAGSLGFVDGQSGTPDINSPYTLTISGLAAAAPEPGTLALVALGIAGFVVRRSRRG